MLSLRLAFMDFSTSLSQFSTFPWGHTGRTSSTSSPSPEYMWLIWRSAWNFSWGGGRGVSTCYCHYKRHSNINHAYRDRPERCSRSTCAGEAARRWGPSSGTGSLAARRPIGSRTCRNIIAINLVKKCRIYKYVLTITEDVDTWNMTRSCTWGRSLAL